MKIYRRSLYLIALLALTVFGCTDRFEEINKNPNNLTEAPYENVLANLVRNVTTISQSGAGYSISAFWSQQIANFTFPRADIYNPRDSDVGNMWRDLYSRTLINAKELIEIGQKEERSNLEAVARLLKVYAFQTATDLWGDVPYSEALQGYSNNTGQVGNLSPAYDTQESIYPKLIAELKQANELFNKKGSDVITSGFDFVYQGDVAKWQKFCNSLLLRLYIRISKVDPASAQAGIEEVLADAATFPVFSSNSDDAQMNFVDATGERNPLFNQNNPDAVSKMMIEFLINHNDPRLAVYAEPTQKSVDAGTPAYAGQPNGSTALPTDSISLIGNKFVQDATAPLTLQTYAEVLFIIAEAANNGWNTNGQSAKQAYDAAITQNLTKNAVSAANITTYLAGTNVNLDNATTTDAKATLIAEQKWAALFLQNEAYAEQRRTDIPVLSEVPKSIFPGKGLPLRLFIPSSEAAVNATNVSTATSGVVDGMFGKKLWWDVQ